LALGLILRYPCIQFRTQGPQQQEQQRYLLSQGGLLTL
jgi:hypothetical protein